jgi:hypothetical protein
MPLITSSHYILLCFSSKISDTVTENAACVGQICLWGNINKFAVIEQNSHKSVPVFISLFQNVLPPQCSGRATWPIYSRRSTSWSVCPKTLYSRLVYSYFVYVTTDLCKFLQRYMIYGALFTYLLATTQPADPPPTTTKSYRSPSTRSRGGKYSFAFWGPFSADRSHDR